MSEDESSEEEVQRPMLPEERELALLMQEHDAALCRREGIAKSLYYSWSKEFLEAGKNRLAGDTARQATAPEVKELRSESAALKEVVAELTLENPLFKKA